MYESVTEVFVEQPGALPGSAYSLEILLESPAHGWRNQQVVMVIKDWPMKSAILYIRHPPVRWQPVKRSNGLKGQPVPIALPTLKTQNCPDSI